MMNAALRRLENKAEINKIQMVILLFIIINYSNYKHVVNIKNQTIKSYYQNNNNILKNHIIKYINNFLMINNNY